MQSVWEFESAGVKRRKSQAQRAGLFIDFPAGKTQLQRSGRLWEVAPLELGFRMLGRSINRRLLTEPAARVGIFEADS